MKRIILLAAAVVALSCQKIAETVPADKQYCRVKIKLSCQDPISKSVFAADDDEVESLAVWIYDESSGKLMKSVVFSDTAIQSGEMELSVPENKNATFLFLANMRAMDAPMLLKDAKALRYTLDSEEKLSRVFPMSFESGNRPVIDSMTINVYLVRMVAEYVFRLDKSNLKGTFTLKSVQLRQSAMDAGIFKTTAATSVADGDSATESELSLVASGGPAFLYMLENCRGLLSGWNTDPWKKIPDDPQEALLATYIEVHATYVSPTMQSQDLTYRMYLGNNGTSNYDITRNTVHVVTLMPSDTGISKGISDTEWKIDPGDYEITGRLTFNRHVAACAAWYDPPYIIRKDGSRVQTLSDSLYIVRSTSKLAYTVSCDTGSTNIESSEGTCIARFKPVEDELPSGSFTVGLSSYDGLLTDSASVYGGTMDLVFRYNHSTGIIQMWSSDKNPRNIKLHMTMDYTVMSSAWGGSSRLNMVEYKDSDSGTFETDIIPSREVQDIDGGLLCSTIRNLSDGIVPAPGGYAYYTPYYIKLDFDFSVVSPSEWKGHTIIRHQCGIFSQSSAGYVNNQYYMGFWYIEYRLDGNLTFYRKQSDGSSASSVVTVVETCHGIQYRESPGDYRSIVLEI